MKNRLVAFLAMVLLAQSLSPLMRELAKAPELVAHFYTHQEEGDELTLLDFLAQHYGSQTHRHNAEHGHSQLPFRSADTSFSTLSPALLLDQPLPPIPVAPAFRPGFAFGSTVFYSGLFVQDIFRPPVG